MPEDRADGRVDAGTGVLPHLTIRDGRCAEAVDVYARALGATEVDRSPGPGGRLYHVRMDLNGGVLMLHDDFPEMRGGEPAPPPAGVTLHLQVEDADAVWNGAVAAGFTVRFPLADQFWGDRYGQLVDPFGHGWSIAAAVRGGS